MRSNRAFCQTAGPYACDMFIGSTLQIDLAGNSSTATLGRIAGFGGAPNMGADARGRRHASPAWLKAGRERTRRRGRMPRGQKLVVQMVETFREHMQPAFVERLDAWDAGGDMGMALPPIMIYGDDVTHIVTEEGIANLLLCRTDDEREQAIRGVAGYTPVGLARDRRWSRTCATAASSAGRRTSASNRAGDARPAGRAVDQGFGARFEHSTAPRAGFATGSTSVLQRAKSALVRIGPAGLSSLRRNRRVRSSRAPLPAVRCPERRTRHVSAAMQHV